MRKSLVVLPLLLGLLAAGPATAADKYAFDPAHTFVGFEVRHLTVSKVRGEFREFEGEILLDEDDISKSSVSAVIKAASLTTGIDRRDAHLKSSDFLSAEEFPDITFQSKRVEKAGEGYVAVGDLTIRGVTKEIALPFTLAGPITDPQKRKRIGVEASTTIDRNEYGVSWNRILEGGGLVVGNEVKLLLNVEAVKLEPKPEASQ